MADHSMIRARVSISCRATPYERYSAIVVVDAASLDAAVDAAIDTVGKRGFFNGTIPRKMWSVLSIDKIDAVTKGSAAQ